MTVQDAARSQGVGAVRHAIAVLRCFTAREPAIGVNEIARRVGLNKSTVSRLIATLEHAEFVERCPQSGRFSLGMGMLGLAAPALAGLDLLKLSRPALCMLARECGETVGIGVWSDPEVIMLEQVLGVRAVTHVARAGDRVPAHCTAAGKIFLAHLDPGRLNAFGRGKLRRFTPRTVVDRAALDAQRPGIRQRGFATNDQEYEMESCGVAAPVRDSGGEVVAVLACAVPKHRFSQAQQRSLAKLICTEARGISRRLGCPDAGNSDGGAA